jgi:Fe2+ or Zn2+ uptake regulation protein
MPGQATKPAAKPHGTRRLPKNYALVRDIVAQSGHGSHQTASDIYLRARKLKPSIGLTTVHRGLTRLSEMGEIMKVQLADADAAWYEPVTQAHAHLLCRRCGSISDVGYATAARTLQSVADRAGVRIDGESITFRGLCRRCAGAKR